MAYPSLLEVLVQQGKVSEEEAKKLRLPDQNWVSLRKNLIESQIVNERELCQLMSDSLGIP